MKKTPAYDYITYDTKIESVTVKCRQTRLINVNSWFDFYLFGRMDSIGSNKKGWLSNHPSPFNQLKSMKKNLWKKYASVLYCSDTKIEQEIVKWRQTRLTNVKI